MTDDAPEPEAEPEAEAAAEPAPIPGFNPEMFNAFEFKIKTETLLKQLNTSIDTLVQETGGMVFVFAGLWAAEHKKVAELEARIVELNGPALEVVRDADEKAAPAKRTRAKPRS